MRRIARSRVAALGLFIGLAFAAPARADAGIPMLMLVWPAAWLLLLLIIPLEAWFARRMLGLSWRRVLGVSALANLASTLVGIPVAWILLVILEMGTGLTIAAADARGWRIPEAVQNALGIALMAPWLGPNARPWMVPAAAAFLCVPFFLVSVLCESLVARRRLADCDTREIRRWAWFANGFTYSIAFVVLVVLAIHAALQPDLPQGSRARLHPTQSSQVRGSVTSGGPVPATAAELYSSVTVLSTGSPRRSACTKRLPSTYTTARATSAGVRNTWE